MCFLELCRPSEMPVYGFLLDSALFHACMVNLYQSGWKFLCGQSFNREAFDSKGYSCNYETAHVWFW